jgi:serine/threonine protein phosphatase PrpC
MSNDVVTECPSCSGPVLFDDRFCETCGTQLLDDDTVDDRDHREIDVEIAAGVTDRGHVHRRNEDALSLQRVGNSVVAVVCDGVSSSVAADSASRVAADVAGRVLASSLTSGLADRDASMHTAVAAAHEAVMRVPWRRARSLAAPACTFVGAVWDHTTITLCGIGDSRAYWIGASSRLLTVDDSWAQEQVDAGTMSEEDAGADSRAHGITRWLGADAPDEPYPVTSFRPDEAGRLIVCSDGLWNYAPSASAIAELVGAMPADASPLELSRALVDAALAAGGHDNVTVAVADVTPPSATKTTPGETP